MALGANLGEARRTLLQAMRRLRQFSDGPLSKSGIWQTTPVECPPGSPLFLNAVVGFRPRPGQTPESLLARLQELEREFGRRPKHILNEPRPLDLDLIAFGGEVRAAPELTLPHPRAHLRRFVLQPLAQIAPALVLPGQRATVAELLERLPVDPHMKPVRTIRGKPLKRLQRARRTVTPG
ncbi:MAG: 2-amino-4-hydroxy-6-hydroxymethyldihydropteridine diphosphokinase [Limisphaerales bacterium]